MFTGHYLSNRSNSTTQQGYYNAVDQGVVSQNSGSLINFNMYVMGGDSAAPASYTGSEMVASIGASMTGTQVTNFCHRTNVYLTAVAGVSSGIC